MLLKREVLYMVEDSAIPKFLNRKFLEWQLEGGYSRTQSEFAEYLGVSQSTLNHWMIGRRKPDYENAMKLSKKLGDEILLINGFLPADPELQKIVRSWNKLDENAKGTILKTISNNEERRRSGPEETD